MKRLILILIVFVAGCGPSQAVNPHPVGTPEYAQWHEKDELDRNLRQARHRFMFEGHEGDTIVNEPSPIGLFRW